MSLRRECGKNRKVNKKAIKLKFEIKAFIIQKIYSKGKKAEMLPSNEDKKLLIESMKKLTHHISNNPVRQKEIFESLASNDLLKIISNLSDDNEYLRRISGLFLGELFYNNNEIKQKATKLLQIYPSEGRICLNQIPPQIQKYPSTFKKCIELMKSPLKEEEPDKFCWTINLDRKVLQIEFFDYKKYSSFTFLDPNRNIFGFTLISKAKRQQFRIQKHYDNNSKEKSVKSIDSRGSSKKQIIGTQSTFYKNYLEFRNRKAESPNSYKDAYEKRDFNKPNTSRNHKNDYMISSYKNISATQNISPHPKNTKQLLSYQKLGTPKKQHYDYKGHLNSSHQSIDDSSSGMRSPIGTEHRQMTSSYRQPQTDRKHDTAYRYKMSDSQIYSSTEKNRYPDTTKNSSISNLQNQKFYKRVKEILKR